MNQSPFETNEFRRYFRKKTGEDGTYVPALLMSSGQKGGVATYGTDSSLSFSSSVEIHDRVDGRGGGELACVCICISY